MTPRESDNEEIAHQGTYLLGGSPALPVDLLTDDTARFSGNLLSRSRRLLYLSHFFNQFSENIWQFCLVLFLAAISNYESILLVCTYGLMSAFFVCYFGSTAGRFIDGTNRMVVARKLIGFENCAVLLATGCCCLLLSNTSSSNLVDEDMAHVPRYEGVPVDPWSLFLLFCVHILGAVAKILDTGFLVAVERDWVVVMSKCAESENDTPKGQKEQQKTWLSQTNVAMKQIDLSCKVIGPTVAGLFVAMFDDGQSKSGRSNLVGAAILVGLLNVAALVVELACTSQIYKDIPSMAFKRVPSTFNHDTGSKLEVDSGNGGTEKPLHRVCFLPLPEALKVYWDQDVSVAGIGLSLL
jgi:MFS family permease